MEKTPLLMGKLTISMAIFNSYVKLPEDNSGCQKKSPSSPRHRCTAKRSTSAGSRSSVFSLAMATALRSAVSWRFFNGERVGKNGEKLGKMWKPRGLQWNFQ